jgi:hypothetical protein
MAWVGHAIALCGGFAAAAALSALIAQWINGAEVTCVIVNSLCWSSGAYAYNDASSRDGFQVDPACHLSNMLNFVWCNEYGREPRPIFANHGRTGYLDANLRAIYEVAARPGVTAIVYMNAPGGLGSFVNAKETLDSMVLLERIRSEYPETATDVDKYFSALDEPVPDKESLARPGQTRRSLVAPGDLRLRTHQARKSLLALFYPVKARCAPVARLRRLLEERPAQQATIRSALSPLFPKASRIRAILDTCAARYTDPKNELPYRHLMASEDIWMACRGRDQWTSWANIAAKICKARGIQLIYYIPPHLNLTDDEHDNVFRPIYVERVRQAFSGFTNVCIIDHSMNRDMNSHDALWLRHDPSRVPFKPGYLFNAIGRLKLARLMVKSFVEAGIIDQNNNHRYVGSAWPGERRLPKEQLSVREFLPNGSLPDPLQQRTVVP